MAPPAPATPPATAATAAPEAAAATPTAPSPANPPSSPAAQPPPATERRATQAAEPDERFFQQEQPRPKRRIHSTGMLVSGIVITSLAPIVFYAGVLSTAGGCDNGGSSCDNDDRLLVVTLATLALLGVGIPLIVTGARREPVAQVRVSPLLSPQLAGLQLHLEL